MPSLWDEIVASVNPHPVDAGIERLYNWLHGPNTWKDRPEFPFSPELGNPQPWGGLNRPTEGFAGGERVPAQLRNFEGMIEPPTIDVTNPRVWNNPDYPYDRRTVQSASFGFSDENGNPYSLLIPTVYADYDKDGNEIYFGPHPLEDETPEGVPVALAHALETGRNLGKYVSDDAASNFGQVLHNYHQQITQPEPSLLDSIRAGALLMNPVAPLYFYNRINGLRGE